MQGPTLQFPRNCEPKLCFRLPILLATMLLTISVARQSAGQATIDVTTTQQGITDPNNCSLQEAIYASEFRTNTAIGATSPDSFYKTGCVPGGGNGDTIVLQNEVYQFSNFWDGDAHNPFGPTATPIIFTNLTIQGNGATLQWTGTGSSRLFAVGYASINDTLDSQTVSGTGTLTLQDVYIKGFHVHGGNGTCGGGGGLGAGGAIYVGKVSSGVPGLTVDKSTFDSNSATGGNGSSFADYVCTPDASNHQAGGGGGGLSGNGGSWTSADGGGGGGGGARGNGGQGNFGGGGGGGTVFGGGDDPSTEVGGAGGYLCGGNGGNITGTGQDGSCPGGGGGGGGKSNSLGGGGSSGGNGNYGGGGGGGGRDDDDSSGSGSGGNGGFGGGGGASGDVVSLLTGTHGGNGGFGGGGGNGFGGQLDSNGEPGSGGAFGGKATLRAGGGGGALGGAIFNDSGKVIVRNSTFTGNFVDRGSGGDSNTDNGADAGGAIFSRNGSLTVLDATISGNQATGSGGGVVVMNDGSGASFTLDNTIIASNGASECFLVNSVGLKGAGNLIFNNSACPGVVVTSNPNLGPLQLNSPGDTPTMALQTGSLAIGAADPATSLPTDQRGVQRKQTPDIGAYETPAPSADLAITKTVSVPTAIPGDTVTYTLVVTNKGPNDANTVTVTDALPPQLTFVSCSESTGSGACTFGGGTVTVTYATLTNGASSTVRINTTLNSGVTDGLSVGNAASVSAASPPDPNTNNDSSTVYFTIHNRADLAVTKSVSTTSPYAPQVEVGDSLTYTATLTNKGPYDARGVVLSDSAPSGVTFTGCTSTTGTCVWSGTSASLSLSALTNGSTATITINATLNFGIADGSTVTNTASVKSTTFDPDTSNNSASASFTALNNSDLYVFQSATKLTSRQLRYTVNVKNLGKYLAKQLVLNDPTPSGSYFVGISPGPWSCSTPPVGSKGTISCSLNTEAVNATRTMTFVVKVTTPGSVLVNNTATVSAATFDPNTANNTSTLGTKVGPQ